MWGYSNKRGVFFPADPQLNTIFARTHIPCGMLYGMQEHIWEREYRKPKLVTGGNEPQASVKEFLRWIRRGEPGNDGDLAKSGLGPKRLPFPLEKISILDLGCGNGKNSNYICTLDISNRAVGIDISETALNEARAQAYGMEVEEQSQYFKHSIGEKLPFPDASFDIALDVTSSNSLNEKERATYLAEVHRALKPGGYLFVRALCKDGDANAQNLIKMNPGPEKDTYILPGLGLTERVFSKEDFSWVYAGAGFDILYLDKETHYTKFAGRSYKRNFWIAYLQKKQRS
ncbi:MAG: SmtA2, SAM-dependent methyltransferase [Candidatus Taylorbacteria bacterium]|nr:SmtA2, SAM-dependent methyltransferase [Candidatus Taylorbacteria bacterium]